MAFQKTENRVAKSGANDVRISFHVADASSPTPGQLIAVVHIETESGKPAGSYAQSFVVTGPSQDAGLTAVERAALRAALVKLRDNALAALGFTDV